MRILFAAAGALGLLSGCAANTGAACDPSKVGNVFQSGYCAGSGSYSARQAEIQAEIDRVRREIALTNEETVRLRGEAAGYARDRRALTRQTASLRAQIAAAKGKIAEIERRNDLEKVRVAASYKTVEDMNRDVSILEQKAQSKEKPLKLQLEISALLKEIETKKKTLNALADTPVI